MAEQIYHDSANMYREVRRAYDLIIERLGQEHPDNPVTVQELAALRDTIRDISPHICIVEHRMDLRQMALLIENNARALGARFKEFNSDFVQDMDDSRYKAAFLGDLEGIGKRTLSEGVEFNDFLRIIEERYGTNGSDSQVRVDISNGDTHVSMIYRPSSGPQTDQRARLGNVELIL